MTRTPTPDTSPPIWKRPIVRVVLVVAAVLLGASLLKEYQDLEKIDPEKERSDAAAFLTDQHDQLLDRLGKQSDRAAAIAELPTLTPWFPVDAPCGLVEHDLSTAKLPAPWRLIWHSDPDRTPPKRYQYRFQRDPKHNAVIWIARRDADCDGLFEVHTISATLGRIGALESTSVQLQNMGE